MSELETTITAVTVYPDRARVTRSGALPLQPGSHQLAVAELPRHLDPASVRVSARGTARARLLGVDVRRDFYVASPTERVRELETQIETLGDEIGGLDAQNELLERERTTVNDLAGQTRNFARGLASGKMNAEAQMALFDTLRSRVQGLNEELLDLQVQRRDLGRRLEKLKKELDQLRGVRGRERYTAVIEVEVSQEGELTVELTYVVSDAEWQPLYDVRLSEDEAQSTLEIGYLAQITQHTGEDWTDVALTLSTARPALAETVPELEPWYIGPIYAAPQAKRRSMALRAAPAPAVEATPADREKVLAQPLAAAPVVEAEVVTATVQTTDAAVTYQVPGRVTLPPDGAPHKVTITQVKLRPEIDYVAAPKLVEAAYRRAQVTNDSPYTLLPGPANLFVSDEFIGATELELIPSQGEIELYLGIDDRVKVERELKRRDVDKRLISDKRRLRYGYEITLENLLSTAAKITLHDQIPVPRHEDIKVKLESTEPEPTERSELELLDWELTLGAGEKQIVRFDFSVQHPREMSLTGLP